MLTIASMPLLIEPCGIEIKTGAETVSGVKNLLIEPCGIEICELRMRKVRCDTFNRTMWN